jgi:steroid 5-alpha reductase family enzyme
MTGPAVLAVGAALLWLLSLRWRDCSIADIAWAPAFALVAWLTTSWPPTPRGLAVLVLVGLWGARLGLHIALRHNGEDRRYAAMRKRHGARWWWRSLFQVFVLQAALVWVIAWPLRAAVVAPAPWRLLDGIGIAFAASGLLFEAVADWQLTRFRADPDNAGRVMDRGLWAWSRHPNYFGDALMWWGFFLVGFAATGTWWLAISPVVMTALLLRVSGVSLMEEDIGERRPDYADYIKRTSAFIPWLTSTPPR